MFRLVVEVEAAIGRAGIGHIRFRHVQGQLRVGAQVRVPGALARRPLRKIRPSACQSRISMRGVAPDLRPCVELSTTGCFSVAAGGLSPWHVFLGRDEYEARS
jgi:hypothetical protein